jgi:hypothetical protein
MGRLGYLILLTLLIAGGAYVFWPEPVEIEQPRLWKGGTPTRYRVLSGGLTQEIDGPTMRIDGIERPLDFSRHDELWSYVRSLKVNESVVTKVPEDQVNAYGLDGMRELSGGGLRLRWGGTGQDSYVWDGAAARLIPCDKMLITKLDALTRRLDQMMLIELPSIYGIAIDGLSLRLENGAWRDVLNAERPAFNRRVNRLYDVVEVLRLDDLHHRAAPLVPPQHQLRFSNKDAAQPERLVRLWPTEAAGGARDGGGLVQVDALPVQRLDAAAYARWTTTLATFAGDYLFNLETEFAARPLGEIRVEDGAQLRFRLEKHGLNDVSSGRSQWDVVWPGGREPASENAAAAIAMAFDDMAVKEPRRRQAGEEPPPTAHRLTFVFKVDLRTMVVAVDGNRIWSPTHVATAVALPGLLARLVPDDMLDNALTLRGSERVVKIQRQWHRGPHAGRSEVVAVSAGAGGVEGSWRQTWPKDAGGAISVLAVDRLARAFCTARGVDVRLPTPADRAVVADPTFELDVRFAPAQVKLSNDHTRLSDTTDQDLGYAFIPEGDRWRAVEKESGISYVVDAEVMEMLQAPLTDDLVMPLVPSLVIRIEITRGDGRYALLRQDEDWRVQALDATGRATGDPLAAETVEVRRFLRLLTSLRALRNDPDAGPLAPEQTAGSVQCTFPASGEGYTRVILNLGQPTGEQMPAVVDSGGMRGTPRGRAWLAADQREVLLPPRTKFLSAPTTPTKPAP